MTVRHSNSYAVTPVWIPKIAHTTDGAIEVVGVTELLVAVERVRLLVLNGDVDVFNLATGWRDWQTVCFKTFQMKLDSFAKEGFGFCNAGSSDDTTR